LFYHRFFSAEFRKDLLARKIWLNEIPYSPSKEIAKASNPDVIAETKLNPEEVFEKQFAFCFTRTLLKDHNFAKSRSFNPSIIQQR
jgi:hypothetical protein